MTEQKHPRELHVGFIGVGVMGRPMVSNLLKAGFPCTIYDINPAPVEALVAEGATSASSAAEVAKSSDIFVTMVVNDAQLAATLFEPGNAASALKPGAIVIGMSTMSVRMVREAAARLQEVGVHYLDAPVSGGEAGATGGTLSIMVGGPPEVFERCKPVLSVLGSNIYHVGQNVGDGQAVKMINQLMVCVHNAVAAEALALGEKAGLDKTMLFEIISKSAGNSWIFSDRGSRMVSENFSPPKSALSILVKDLGFVVDTANNMGYPLILGSITYQLYKMASIKGWDKLDDSIMIKLMEEIAGLGNKE
ncbi:MAG: NAD(P)-dependent oxidoreductase [Chloroflexi bacterium]|nr:MAG: NAD(P)-dependent oxidoreductase [Chloroflexota bacterium]TMD40826.1 MAG: NAD(P)-dependent oxidoreductase [Chloroflexota bacterium]